MHSGDDPPRRYELFWRCRQEIGHIYCLADEKRTEEEGNKKEVAYCVDPSFSLSSDTDSFLLARVLDQICEGFRSRYMVSPEV